MLLCFMTVSQDYHLLLQSSAVHVEAQLLLGGGQSGASLLSGSKVKQATIIVQRDTGREDQPLPGVLTPMLAYRKVDDFDPRCSNIKLDHLGYVNFI